ncbi:MAG: HDOD domain-containing protein [Gemmatimonadales bacterium]|nr:HDOD domain-containing protein [Gemmatimonadales bacterium]
MPTATPVDRNILVLNKSRNRSDGRTVYELHAIQDADLLTRHSFSGSLVNVLKELAKELANNASLAMAIEGDIHFQLAVQQVANSAYYRTRDRLPDDSPPDLETCVRELGWDTVGYLALRQGILRLSPASSNLAAPLVAHLFVVAEIARQLGRIRSKRDGDRAYIAGLVHDFGKLTLLQAQPEFYGKVAGLCRRQGIPTRDAERRMLATDIVKHADHAYIGALVLAEADLDPEIVAAVEGHHDPLPDPNPEVIGLSLIEIVQIANLLANRAGFTDGFAHGPVDSSVDPVVLSRLDLSPAHQREIVELAVEKAGEAIHAVTDPKADRRQREWNDRVRNILQAGDLSRKGETSITRPWLAVLDFLVDREEASLSHVLEFSELDPEPVQTMLTELTEKGYLTHHPDKDPEAVWTVQPRLRRAQFQDLLDDGPITDDEPERPDFLSQEEGGRAVPLSLPQDEYVDAAWSPDGSRLALRRRDGEILQWHVEENREVARIPAANSRIAAMTWAADSRTLMMGTEAGEILVAPGGQWNRSEKIETGSDAILACSLSSANSLLATGSRDGGVQLWHRSREGAEEKKLGYHQGLVNDIAWSRDGSLLASASADGTARIWNPETGVVKDILAYQDTSVQRVAWSPDGRWLATGSAGGSVRIWSVEGRNYTVHLDPVGGPISRLSYSADGTLLAAQDQEGGTCFWHTENWTPVGKQVPWERRDYHRHLEGCLAFHPWTNQVMVSNGNASPPQILKWAVDGMAALIARLSKQEWTVVPKPIGPHDRPGMSPLTLVHLSDLHFRADDDIRSRVIHLHSDLTNQVGVRKVDFVVISGDLVNRAKKDEYLKAREFIESLRQKLRLARDHVLTVPGNHDVDWGDDACQYQDPDTCPDILAGVSCHSLEMLPAQSECEKAYRRRFQNFGEEFYRAVYGKPYALDYEDQFLHEEFPEKGIRFIGYNSAWQTDSIHPQAIDVHPDAMTNLIERRLKWNDEQPLMNIGILHHPVHYGLESVPAGFTRHLDRLDIELALHGHIHEAAAEYTGYLKRRGTVLLATGSFDAESEDIPEGMRQEYQILELNLPDHSLDIISRHKNPSERDWDENCKWYGDDGSRTSRRHIQLG